MARKARIPDEEPHTMAWVEQLIRDTWPTCVSYVTWHEGPQPVRHVAVKFGKPVSQRLVFEGSGATWREAFIEVERQRQAHKPEGR